MNMKKFSLIMKFTERLFKNLSCKKLLCKVLVQYIQYRVFSIQHKDSFFINVRIRKKRRINSYGINEFSFVERQPLLEGVLFRFIENDYIGTTYLYRPHDQGPRTTYLSISREVINLRLFQSYFSTVLGFILSLQLTKKSLTVNNKECIIYNNRVHRFSCTPRTSIRLIWKKYSEKFYLREFRNLLSSHTLVDLTGSRVLFIL